MPRPCRFALLLFVAAILGAPAMVHAQVPGPTPPPGTATPQPQVPGAVPPGQDLGPGAPDNTQRDVREAMRQFIQAIAAYARGQRRDFAVVPMDGLALLVKTDPVQPDVVLPAPAYTRAITGVMQEGLFTGVPELGKATEKDRRERLLGLAERAKKNGLPVLVMDYATDPKTIDAAQALAAKQGFVFFGAPGRGLALNALPRYPRRPFAENSHNVLSLRDVKNFLMLHETSSFGREDELALKLHDNNYDLVILDVFRAGGEALSKRAVETLKYKKLGARRLVFAYIDIATAASDAYYWKAGWREGSPKWLSAPMPANPDQYFVEYWQPEWQQIIFGNPNSYLYGVIAQGFDGVILGGIDSYLFYEGGLEAWQGAEK